MRYGKNLSLGVMKMEETIAKHEKAKRDYNTIEETINQAIREELEILTGRY